MKVYKSETFDNLYYQVELENGYGTMYEVYTTSDGDIAEKYIRTYLWNNYDEFHGCEYDTELTMYEIEFLQDIFDNVRKI